MEQQTGGGGVGRQCFTQPRKSSLNNHVSVVDSKGKSLQTFIMQTSLREVSVKSC